MLEQLDSKYKKAFIKKMNSMTFENRLKLADLYLNLYCRKSGLSKDEIFEWPPLIAGARLADSVSAESSQRLLGILNQYLT